MTATISRPPSEKGDGGGFRYSWFDVAFRPFDELRVPCHVEPSTPPFDKLKAPSSIEGLRLDPERGPTHPIPDSLPQLGWKGWARRRSRPPFVTQAIFDLQQMGGHAPERNLAIPTST